MSADPSAQPHARSRTVRWTPVLLAAIAVLICTNGPSTFVGLNLVHPPDLEFESWQFLVPLAAVATGGTLALLGRGSRETVRALGWPAAVLAAFLAVTVLSSTWSVAPHLTPVRSLTGVGIACFGVWFGRHLDIVEQMWAVGLGTHAGLAASVVVLLVSPKRAKMDEFLNHPYWKGIWGNRNSLAPVCVLAMLTVIGLAFIVRGRRFTALTVAVVLVDLRLLVGAGSDTAIVALVVVLAVAFVGSLVLGLLARRRVSGRLVGLLTVPAAFAVWRLFFLTVSRAAAAAGKDSSLTSRRPIWSAVRSLIRIHPLRGFGWWAVWDSHAVDEVYARLGSFGSAHNGLLEVLLGTGVLGALPFTIFAISALSRPFRLVWQARSVEAVWWTAVVTFAFVENLTESFVLWHSYIWVLVVAAAFVPGTGLGRSPTRSARLDQ